MRLVDADGALDLWKGWVWYLWYFLELGMVSRTIGGCALFVALGERLIARLVSGI